MSDEKHEMGITRQIGLRVEGQKPPLREGPCALKLSEVRQTEQGQLQGIRARLTSLSWCHKVQLRRMDTF